MSESKHTSGPWRMRNEPYDDGKPYIIIEAGPGDYGFFDFETKQGFHITAVMSEDDGRLISAAPDLLAFANSLLIFQIEGDEGRLHVKFGKLQAAMDISSTAAKLFLAINSVRSAAIAKATGSAS